MKQFGKRLKELREEKGLSLEQLASEIGVSSACISRWENELRVPNIDNAVSLCQYFKVSADYLLGLNDSIYK